MLRLLLVVLLPISCPVYSASPWTPKLSYKIHIEPSQEKLEIQGELHGIRPGTYYFTLPRTQGHAIENFVTEVSFRDASGTYSPVFNEDREWKVKTRHNSISFSYHINLKQAARFSREAWGGATNYLDEDVAFLNGSLSFIIPLIKGLDQPIEVEWHVPPAWRVLTPWSQHQHQTTIPSHYALVRNYYTVYRTGSMFTSRIRSLNVSTVWLGVDDINAFPQARRSIEKVIGAALTLFGFEASRESITLILRDSNPSNQFRASTEANSIEFNFKQGMSFERIWNQHRESFLRLLAHEIMHTWDRRKLKDATAYLHVREWGFNTCWIREGFTEYFAMLTLFNAGIYDRDDFLNSMYMLSQTAHRANRNGALNLVSSCEMFYVEQNALDYVYTEGASLAFLLDLSLREQTNGVKSLPEFMRSFMTKYRYQEKTVEAFLKEWKEYAPSDLSDLDRHYTNHTPTDFSAVLKRMGVQYTAPTQGRVPQWDVLPNATFRWYFQ